jgi:hypothetical protein
MLACTWHLVLPDSFLLLGVSSSRLKPVLAVVCSAALLLALQKPVRARNGRVQQPLHRPPQIGGLGVASAGSRQCPAVAAGAGAKRTRVGARAPGLQTFHLLTLDFLSPSPCSGA